MKMKPAINRLSCIFCCPSFCRPLFCSFTHFFWKIIWWWDPVHLSHHCRKHLSSWAIKGWWLTILVERGTLTTNFTRFCSCLMLLLPQNPSERFDHFPTHYLHGRMVRSKFYGIKSRHKDHKRREKDGKDGKRGEKDGRCKRWWKVNRWSSAG